MGKRGSVCSICRHERRHQIEIGLVHRVPLRVLAQRFDCSRDALHRHKHRHLTPQMAAAILAAQKPSEVDLEQLQRCESEGLLGQLVTQRARLQQHSEMALELGDVRTAVVVERCIVSNLELVAKLLGQLVQRHEVSRTSILVSADYLELRETLLRTLRPFPEAARAVSAALHDLETKAARDIVTSKTPIMLEASPA
jgi:hypothetical protein